LVGVAGLYKVSRIKRKDDLIQEIYLTPNKARLPTIIYRFYDNETKMINAYKLGEINQMIVYKKTIADTFTSWKNTEIIQGVDYSRLLTIFLNLNNPIFKEKDVRQAIALAIDRKKIEEQGNEATGPIPPSSWGYNPNLKKNSFDLELAKQLIKKNLTATDSAKITISTFYEYIDVASIIKEMFNQIGFNTSVNIVSNINSNSFDVLLAYWNVPSDPDQYYYWHSTQQEGNITNYKNLKVDKYLEDGRSTAKIEDRKKIYYEFQKVIIDDNPAIFVYYPYIYTIKRK
jgi:peptide/nickel transport system substrate-binding protein